MFNTKNALKLICTLNIFVSLYLVKQMENKILLFISKLG